MHLTAHAAGVNMNIKKSLYAYRDGSTVLTIEASSAS